MLRLECPSCGRQCRKIEAAGYTQVVRRTCRCGERWQIVVRPVAQTAGARVDRLDWAFLGHTAKGA